MASPLDVAIHLTATNGVSSVLAVIAKDVLGLHGSVEKLQKGLGALKPALVGAAAILGGSVILAGVKELVDKGNDLVKIQRDMGAAGATNLQVQKAYAEAWKLTGQYQNISAVEIMKMANEARMTFGDQDKATAELHPFVESMSFLKSYQGGKHANSASLLSEMNAAMKSGELAGKITPEEMTEHVRQLTAMKVAYGEGLKISSYLAAQRTAGVALRNTSDEFRYGIFPALVQEQGSSAGVMLMTAFNKIVAGTGNRTKSLEHMAEIGLLNRDQLEYDKVGRIKGLKNPDAIKGSTEAAMNFGSWVMTTLKPLLDKQTAGLDPQKANIKESQLISAMFPDRNAAKAITEVIQQFSKLTKDAEQMMAARKSYDAQGYNQGSWDYQVQAFQTQWTNLVTALGAPSVASATAALAKVNSAITEMAQWTAAHPNVAKAIVGTMTAVGTALVAFGTIMVGGAIVAAIGLVGPITAGIAAVAAALVGLGVAAETIKPGVLQQSVSWIGGLWRDFGNAILQMGRGIANFNIGQVVAGFLNAFDAALGHLPSMVAPAISSAIAAIGTMIANAIKSISPNGKIFGPQLPGPKGGKDPNDLGLPGLQGYAAPLAPKSKTASLELHHTSTLDGRKVAHSVTRHQVAMLEHPRSIGAMDSYGSHAGPGTDLPAWG